jgi:acetyl esterase
MSKAFLFVATLGATVAVVSAACADPLDPAAKTFAAAAAKATPLYTLSYPQARTVLETIQAGQVPSPPTTAEDASWAIGPTGEVRVRIIRPAGQQGKLPVIMYFHGGGWVLGSSETHDHLIRELAAQTRAALVFVEYGNAPEVHYPTNNEQAYAALEYVARNANALKLDSSRIAVAGDSAGGHMAASVTLMAKERHGPRIAHQVLFYPVTQDISNDQSYRLFGNGPFLTEKAMEYFLTANFPGKLRDEAAAFPMRASETELRGLPGATVILAEDDPLRSEGEAYARKLREAGVPVTSTEYKGTIHDFVMLNALADTPAAKGAISQASAELRSAFSASGSDKEAETKRGSDSIVDVLHGAY